MRILLQGGAVIDGTGRAPFAADVWIKTAHRGARNNRRIRGCHN